MTNQKWDPSMILTRMFEGMPPLWEAFFRPGDRVKLIRPIMFDHIPVGTEGVIESVDHPDGTMYSKGRPFMVMFNASPPQEIIEALKAAGIPEAKVEHSIGTHVGPNDIALVDEELSKQRKDEVAQLARTIRAKVEEAIHKQSLHIIEPSDVPDNAATPLNAMAEVYCVTCRSPLAHCRCDSNPPDDEV